MASALLIVNGRWSIVNSQPSPKIKALKFSFQP